jgi:hypothetical protein
MMSYLTVAVLQDASSALFLSCCPWKVNLQDRCRTYRAHARQTSTRMVTRYTLLATRDGMLVTNVAVINPAADIRGVLNVCHGACRRRQAEARDAQPPRRRRRRCVRVQPVQHRDILAAGQGGDATLAALGSGGITADSGKVEKRDFVETRCAG